MTDSKTPAQEDTISESVGWRPEPGDVLEGEVVNVGRAWSDFTNSFYPLVTIHDKARDEDVDVHAFHQTLHSRFMELKPKIGTAIKVEYAGKRRTKDDKREVAIYRVTVPGDTGESTWASLDTQPSRAARAADDDDLPF